MSEIKVNKLSPRSGTAVTLGDSGDTFTIPSGATLAIAGSVTGFTSAGIDDNATSVAITIDSSERVGIGTTSPEHLLDVISSDSVPARIRSTANSNMALEIDSASNRNANIEFKENDSSKWFVGNEASSDAFRFFSSTANSESMRITSAGLVGIGISSPTAPLHIDTNTADANNPFVNFDNNDGNIGQVRMTSSGDFGFRANTGGTGQMFFQVGGSTEAMRILSDGKVGIGETTPLGKLHVKTSDVGASVHQNADDLVLENNGNTGITIASSDTATGAIFFADSSNQFDSWIQYTHSSRALQFAAAGQERMRIDSSGRLNLGTTTSISGSLLNIDGGFINANVVDSSHKFIRSTTATTGLGDPMICRVNTSGDMTDGFASVITFQVSDSGVSNSSLGFIGATRSGADNSGSLIFHTYNSGSQAERMRIDSSGNLKFDSGYGSVATAYGCRAWVNFNGTGTVAIRDSGNISSITDLGTGYYQLNFATAMPDVNYALSGMSRGYADGFSNASNFTTTSIDRATNAISTGFVKICSGRTGPSGSTSSDFLDMLTQTVAVFR